MERFFNTAGPMIPDEHYCIDPLTRLDWDEIRRLINNKRYFVLHAPRQTGKTSTLLSIAKALNNEGRYACAYANIEVAQTAKNEENGIRAVCDAISISFSIFLSRTDIQKWYINEGLSFSSNNQLFQLLRYWSESSVKPTILILDEVDALVGDTLISLLRQIRSGYVQRPGKFPHSIILCGVRDVRDYRIQRSDGEIITGGSAFNIKTESMRMMNFSFDETKALWRQYTDDTGQEFENAVFQELWEDTYGQPWLVNALGYELTEKTIARNDKKRKITISDYKIARERLIQSRATHLDQLADKLQEPRVANVIKSILDVDQTEMRSRPADIEYVEDLGLIKTKPSLCISNRIYMEVIPRELTWSTQVMISNQQQEWYILPDHRLDMQKLLTAFQQFYRQNADSWLEHNNFKEAGPQLLLQAFLQRIINGGGIINREYGLGRKRTDLYIEWPTDIVLGLNGPLQRIVIEIKLRRGAIDTVIAQGIEQTAGYAFHAGADESHLVIFDSDRSKTWDERIWRRVENYKNIQIYVWGA